MHRRLTIGMLAGGGEHDPRAPLVGGGRGTLPEQRDEALVEIADALTHVLEHLEGKRRIAADLQQERSRLEDEDPRVPARPYRGIPRQGLEQRHLPEEAPPTEHRERDLPAVDVLRDHDAPALEDEHLATDVPFAHDDLAIDERLFSVKDAGHRPSRCLADRTVGAAPYGAPPLSAASPNRTTHALVRILDSPPFSAVF